MKKTYLFILLLLSAGWLSAQTTETFEDETDGATSFTNNGQVFNITTATNLNSFESFNISSEVGTGWSGTANDNRYIDNSNTANYTTVSFTISSANSAIFKLKSIYLFLSQTDLTSGTGNCTITGKLKGNIVFTAAAVSNFNSSTTNNGYTLIDFASYGGTNNANKIIDQYVITTSGNFEYVALDAMKWIDGCVDLTMPMLGQTNVTCNAGSNGTAYVSATTGGTAPYSYNWTPGNPSGDGTTTVFGLTSGSWNCTVTDANGCMKTQTFTITEPSAITATTIVSNVSCNGGTNGSIDLTPTGGTPGYTYNWGGGIVSQDRTGLAEGSYSCTITDANGCSKTENITITQPSAITATTIVSNVSCNGGTNGSIDLTPAGGTPGYTYNWGGGIVSQDRTGLAAGSYSCTITDANGCMKTVTGIIITQPATIDASVTVSSGVITTTQAGATYQWYQCPSTLLIGENNQTFTPTSTGDYKVEVTVGGCMLTSVCITISSLGNQNFESKAEILIYPNPSSDVFFIESKASGTITVNDLQGKIIQTQKINSGISPLNMSKAAAGVYLLNVTTDNNQAKTVKLIKK